MSTTTPAAKPPAGAVTKLVSAMMGTSKKNSGDPLTASGGGADGGGGDINANTADSMVDVEIAPGEHALRRMGTKDVKREQEADKMMERVLIEKKVLQVAKDRMVERLVLEQTMEEEFIRCVLFFVGFMSFLMMLYTAYPADALLPVHETISNAYNLGDISDVATLDDVKEFLATMARQSRYFSPGSRDYVSDPLGRAYLPEVVRTPPFYHVRDDNQPKLTKEFTLTVWLKTSVRYETIITKRKTSDVGGGSKTCYDFSLENVRYGQHETASSSMVINPSAASIYKTVDQQTEWRRSTLKSEMEDGQWHHLAIIVNQTHLVYAHDAVLQAAVSLPRPITDCLGGHVVLGSEKTAGELVSFRWFPRVLTASELGDAKSAGKPLEDLLASSGAEALIPSDVQVVQNQLGGLGATSTRQHNSLMLEATNNTRKLSSLLLNTLASSSSTSASTTRRRRLQEEEEARRRLLAGTPIPESQKKRNKHLRYGVHGNRELAEYRFVDGGHQVATVAKPTSHPSQLHEPQQRRLTAPDPNAGQNPGPSSPDPNNPDPNNQSPDPNANQSPDPNAKQSPDPNANQSPDPNANQSPDPYQSSPGMAGAKEESGPPVIINGNLQISLGMDLPESEMTPESTFAQGVCTAAVQALVQNAADTATAATQLQCKVQSIEAARRRELAADDAVDASADTQIAEKLRRLAMNIVVTYQINVPGSLTPTVMPSVDPAMFDSSFSSALATATGYTVSSLVSENQPQQQSAPQAMVDFSAFFSSLDFSQESTCGNTNTTWCLRHIEGVMGMQVVFPDLAEAVASLQASLAAGIPQPTYMPFCDDYIISDSDTRLVNAADCLALLQQFAYPLMTCYMTRGVTMVVDNPDKLTDWIIFRSVSDNDKLANPHGPPKYNCEQDVAAASGLSITDLSWSNTYNGFDKWFVGAFRRAENLACKSGVAQVLTDCQRLCAQCGVQYSPVVSQVLDAVQECADAAGYTDWQGNGCAWYHKNDPTCTLYADTATRGNCTMTCNTCGKTHLMVSKFDITTDENIEPNELNALLVSTRKESMRVSYHDLTRVIGWLCCYEKLPTAFVAQSPACQGLAMGKFDDGVAYKLLKTIELTSANAPWSTASTAKKKWTEWGFEAMMKKYMPEFFYDSQYQDWKLEVLVDTIWKEECVNVYSDRQKMALPLLTNPTSPLNMPLLDCLTVFESSMTPRASLMLGRASDSEVVYGFASDMSTTQMKNANLERSWLTFDQCSTHANCTSVFPYACQYVEDSNNPFELYRPAWKDGTGYANGATCDPYSTTKRQPMYCAKRCLTGGCGATSDVVWGAQAPANFGYCQPCNGCLTTETFDGSACPSHCRTGMPATVTLAAGEFTVEENPNAIGGFTLDAWVKMFNYQFVLKKTKTVSGLYPNHRWMGYEVSEVAVANVDKYFPAACREFDGVYASTSGAFDWRNVQMFQALEHKINKHQLVISVEFAVSQSTTPLWILHVSSSSGVARNPECYGHFGGTSAKVVFGYKHSTSHGPFSTGIAAPVQQQRSASNVLFFPAKTPAATGSTTEVGAGISSLQTAYASDISIQPHKGELACFRLDYNQFCFRQKWWEATWTCVSNPYAGQLLGDEDWHHYVVVKRSSMSYKKANADGALHDVARTDSLEVFVDGQVASSLPGLEAGTNPVPKWGAVDCGGVMMSTSLINSPTMDGANALVYQNIAWNQADVEYATTGNTTAGVAADVTVRTFREDMGKMFPMTGTLPLGGNMTITAFTFPAVEVPRSGYVWSAKLVLCAADLLANLRYWQIGCTSTTEKAAKERVELEIFAVAASVISLDDTQKVSDPCYYHNLARGTKKVTMTVQGALWREKAVFHQPNGTRSANFVPRWNPALDCQEQSVDIKEVIDEITSDPGWTWGRQMTLLVAEKGMIDQTCSASLMSQEVVTGADMVTALQKASVSPCKTIEDIKNKLNDHFPLWVAPFEDASNQDMTPAMLNVEWCLNKECTSPHFNGAGADVKFGGTSATATTTPPPTTPPPPMGGGPGGGPGGPPPPMPRRSLGERDHDEYDDHSAPPRVFSSPHEAYALRRPDDEWPPRSQVMFVPENVVDHDDFVRDQAHRRTEEEQEIGYNQGRSVAAHARAAASLASEKIEQMSALARPEGQLPALRKANVRTTNGITHHPDTRVLEDAARRETSDNYSVVDSFFRSPEDLSPGVAIEAIGNSGKRPRNIFEELNLATSGYYDQATSVEKNAGSVPAAVPVVLPAHHEDTFYGPTGALSAWDHERVTSSESSTSSISAGAAAQLLAADISPVQRQLTSNGTSATSATLLGVRPATSAVTSGTLQLAGLPRDGKMYGLKFTNRAMKSSEVQFNFYKDRDTVNQLAGPVDVILPVEGNDDATLEIDQFPQEVVSIVPPVLLQSRTDFKPCTEQVPGLARNLLAYFEAQVEQKCSRTYNCDYPQDSSRSGFACIDREDDNLSTGRWFSRESLEAEGLMIQGSVFPEFLDTLTIPTVYKDRQILSSDSYIDMRTKEVSVINVFLNSKLRSGTILEVNFKYGGPGKIEAQYKMLSSKQMDPDTQATWSVWVTLVYTLSILDLFLLALGTIQTYRERQKWKHNIEMDGAIPLNTPGRVDVWKRIDYGLRSELPLWSGWDVFDVALRIFNLIFTVNHYNHYYSPKLGVAGVERGEFEELLNKILVVPWPSATLRYEEKVTIFMQQLANFAVMLDQDSAIRTTGYLLVLLMFFRIVAYLRVHPRIAVLYKTIEVALDDLFHFFIVFGLLYAVLAFIGVWMFGAINPKFASFMDSFITQFEMLMGEYPWPESTLDQNFGLFFSYLNIYSLVVFFILLNFLLAIIVDSYASVKEMVNTCEVECNILTDIVALLCYPYMRVVYQWPERGELIRKLLALDVNFDFINDEEEEEDSVAVTESALVRGKVFPSAVRARQFLNYYLFLAPALDVDREEDAGALEHQRKLRALRNLDILRERLLEAALNSGLIELYRPPPSKPPLGSQLETLKSEVTNQLDEMSKEATLMETKLKKLEDGGSLAVQDETQKRNELIKKAVVGVAKLHTDDEQKEAADKIFGHFLKPGPEAMKASLAALKKGTGRTSQKEDKVNEV
ncbi:unnamed protein product [Amoebophrya sp. A120]|nr:unnamed protein product [Amoebophrya sp. A120]|eukprot:GSA120T00002044001.1